MAKRKSSKKTVKGRSPVPPPTITFKDRRKEASQKACRGPRGKEDDPEACSRD